MILKLYLKYLYSCIIGVTFIEFANIPDEIFFTIFLLFQFQFSYTQPGLQNIGGIINNYTPVIDINSCNNSVTVEDASAFNVGDTILMIQMKGVVIDSSNSSAFGTVLNYKNAGNYEFNYVKSKTGNNIELVNTLTRQYDFPTGKVQLVRVPYYTGAIITTTLTCLPWDGSKGGILVLNAADSIVFKADIDVSGKGSEGAWE